MQVIHSNNCIIVGFDVYIFDGLLDYYCMWHDVLETILVVIDKITTTDCIILYTVAIVCEEERRSPNFEF